MLTTIPFSGFYGSIHDSEIDRALESMVSDSSGCYPVSPRIAEDLWMHTSDIRTEYTREYVEDFQIMFNGETGLSVSLKWESVSSPRFYNFSTDRIFAEVSFKDVQAMFAKVDRKVLDRTAKDRFTSYDGFISHYSPNWRTWGSMTEWDHNQVGTLIEALVSQYFDEDWEYGIIGEWESNGIISDWVYSALDDEGKRLVKLADYLREREERQYRRF